MQSNNESIRNVADIARRIISGESPEAIAEALKGGQHKIDKNKNNKIDAEDFKMLRKEEQEVCEKCGCNPCECVVEESDVVEEGNLTRKAQKVVSTTGDVAGAVGTLAGGAVGGAAKTAGVARQALPATKDAYNRGRAATQKAVAEETEELDEVKMADLPSRKVQGKSYGASKPKVNPFDVLKGPKSKDLDAIKKDEKKMVPDWARGPNESVSTFSAMLESYKQDGLKSLAKMNKLKEEPDNEQFTKEVEEVKKKASEKKSPEDEARVAKGQVDAVKVEENIEQIDEREMTDAEMEKREDIVKGMKKNIKGFKARYGDRAKNVMYATATKQAMKEENDEEV